MPRQLWRLLADANSMLTKKEYHKSQNLASPFSMRAQFLQETTSYQSLSCPSRHTLSSFSKARKFLPKTNAVQSLLRITNRYLSRIRALSSRNRSKGWLESLTTTSKMENRRLIRSCEKLNLKWKRCTRPSSANNNFRVLVLLTQ